MQFRDEAEQQEYMHGSGRSYVSLSFLSGDDVKLGTIVLELFTDLCPRTCENFLKLVSNTHSCKMGYKGSPIHRVVEHAYIQVRQGPRLLQHVRSQMIVLKNNAGRRCCSRHWEGRSEIFNSRRKLWGQA